MIIYRKIAVTTYAYVTQNEGGKIGKKDKNKANKSTKRKNTLKASNAVRDALHFKQTHFG